MLWDCVRLPLQPPNAILMLAPGRLHPYSPRRPLTEAHRPRARRAVKAIDAPAYDPKRLFAQRLTCKYHKPQLCGPAAYSITSVARNRKLSEMLRPIALAVLRFTTISNLVGN